MKVVALDFRDRADARYAIPRRSVPAGMPNSCRVRLRVHPGNVRADYGLGRCLALRGCYKITQKTLTLVEKKPLAAFCPTHKGADHVIRSTRFVEVTPIVRPGFREVKWLEGVRNGADHTGGFPSKRDPA